VITVPGRAFLILTNVHTTRLAHMFALKLRYRVVRNELIKLESTRVVIRAGFNASFNSLTESGSIRRGEREREREQTASGGCDGFPPLSKLLYTWHSPGKRLGGFNVWNFINSCLHYRVSDKRNEYVRCSKSVRLRCLDVEQRLQTSLHLHNSFICCWNSYSEVGLINVNLFVIWLLSIRPSQPDPLLCAFIARISD
jgi:hypothetical protein